MMRRASAPWIWTLFVLRPLAAPMIFAAGYMASLALETQGQAWSLLYILLMVPAYAPFPWLALLVGMAELMLLQQAFRLLPFLAKRTVPAALAAYLAYGLFNAWISARVLVASGGF